MTRGGGEAFAIEPLGETMLLLRFGERIDAAVNGQVHAAAQMLRDVEMPGLVDLIPSYAALALRYDAAFWAGRDGTPAWQHLAGALRAVFAKPPRGDDAAGRLVEVPACYDGEDLDAVAAHARLCAEVVVARHAAAEYRVAMLGFAPGFSYLLGLDPALHVPRRAQPRLRVPAGSIAIGGMQTGIYPRELPGGWQLIGRTPLRLFDARLDPPTLFMPGDRVRFRAIDAREFDALLAQARA